jgi:hypothetical protein
MGLEFIHTLRTVTGHSGSIAGCHTIVLATEDGSRGFALVVNQHLPTPAVNQAFAEAAVGLMRRLFPAEACDPAPAGRAIVGPGVFNS